MPEELVSVRCMVNGVQEAIAIHFIEDIAGEVARLRDAGVSFRNEIVTGPGGQQIVREDPSRNPIELFQQAGR